MRFWPHEMAKNLIYPKMSMGDMLRKASSHNADGTAIIFGDIAISYAQLDKYTGRFAASLARIGIVKGDRAALYLPNTPQFIISYYGILRLGGVVVACSPLYKERELLHQLNDSEARTIICLASNQQIVENVLKDSMIKNVITVDAEDLLTELPSANERDGISVESHDGLSLRFSDLLQTDSSPVDTEIDPSRDLALLQYTGGTTGTPKAAMITHRNLVVNAIQFSTWLSFRHDDVHISALPLFHIYGMTTSMNAPIYSASTMVLVHRFEPTRLLETIGRYKPTVFCGVPTMYMALVNHPGIEKHNLRSIRLCISGAAPLPAEVQRKFEQITGGRLAEGYGLTEASPVTHVNPLDDPKNNRMGSIGIPIFDTEAKIVDLETGEKDLISEEAGELVIRGPQVMLGYWKNPEETCSSLKCGWLHTGDIAKMDADGYFHIVDRKKDMINVSGLKIYPREIEEVLYEHPRVREACVVGVPDPYRGERVKGYVVLEPGAQEKTVSDELISFCKQRIADYKVPSELEFILQMPKTSAGKIDRRAFREKH